MTIQKVCRLTDEERGAIAGAVFRNLPGLHSATQEQAVAAFTEALAAVPRLAARAGDREERECNALPSAPGCSEGSAEEWVCGACYAMHRGRAAYAEDDALRLDWLQRQLSHDGEIGDIALYVVRDHVLVDLGSRWWPGPTLRDAIDSARAARAGDRPRDPKYGEYPQSGEVEIGYSHLWEAFRAGVQEAQENPHVTPQQVEGACDAYVKLIAPTLPARAGDREGEPDLWWPSDDGEASYPDAGEAAYGIEQETGTIREFDVARTCGKRWVAMLPTDFERDDGWEGGIGWLDGEPESFTTYAAAVQAVEKRKADLLAAPGGETRKEGLDG